MSRRPIIYQVVLRLRRGTWIRVGRLGRFRFPAGFYVYTGSGGRSPEKRIARHLRRRKSLRWHVDYLQRRAAVVGVWRGTGEECRRSRWTARLPGATIPAPGFGSSDCGCPSHLVHFAALPKALVEDRRYVPAAAFQDARTSANFSR